MDRGLGQAGFRIGMFVAFTSAMLLLVVERDSAEYPLMVITFTCSALFLTMLALLVRFFSRR